MLTLPERIFFTGVPGSRWSGTAQWIESNVPGFNVSDRNKEREFDHVIANPNLPSGHRGAYFGTGMEYELRLEDPEYIDSPWEDTEGCKIIKSHEWPSQLDKIKELYPNDWIMLVYRPDLASQSWWHETGAFKMPYPNYDHYEDSIGMFAAIMQQNKDILKFAKKHDATWYHIGSKFMKTEFGVDIKPMDDFFYDVLITIIK